MTFQDLTIQAKEDGRKFFNPKLTSSLSVQIHAAQSHVSDHDFAAYVTVTYDEERDTHAPVTGGKAIKVPGY